MGCTQSSKAGLEEEVAHLKREIAYLQQGGHLQPSREDVQAIVTRKVEMLKNDEVTYDLLSSEAKAQYLQNCVNLVHVEFKLTELREGVVQYKNARRVLELNIDRALVTASWEDRLRELQEDKVSQKKALQQKHFDLESFEQRKLNAELSKLRISKEHARENFKAAKLTEAKDKGNKNAKGEFALKRKELNARKIHQEKEYKEATEGVQQTKQDIVNTERRIVELNRDIVETTESVLEARCLRILTKLDSGGSGFLTEAQVVRVLRAQCLLDAVTLPEVHLLVNILSLFRQHGVRILLYYWSPFFSCFGVSVSLLSIYCPLLALSDTK
jgi:hypothetical protein